MYFIARIGFQILSRKDFRIRIAIKNLMLIVIGVTVVWIGLRFLFGTNNPIYIVSSGSMVPSLHVNDLLVVTADSGMNSFDNLKIGDVIVFHKPESAKGEYDQIIVHRVVEINNNYHEIIDIPSNSHGEKVIRTKGDANQDSIPGTDYPIRKSDYIGRVTYIIPNLGLLTKAITPPFNYIIITMLLITILFNFIKPKNNKQ